MMRIGQDGLGTCTKCSAAVVWVKSGERWAGIVSTRFVSEFGQEPYNGTGIRKFATRLTHDAVLHTCNTWDDAVKRRFDQVVALTLGGEKVKAEPKAPVIGGDEMKDKPAKPAGENPLVGLTQWIEAKIAEVAQESVNEERVSAIVAEAIAALPKPGEVVIERIFVAKSDGNKVEVKGHVHPAFGEIMMWVGLRIPVWMPGRPGSGKSHLARQIAETLGVSYYELVLSPADTPGKITGFFAVDGNTVVSTEFRKAWIEGGVVHIEEVANGNPASLVTLNSALANGHCTFPDGQYPRHADCIVLASDNTWGLGGDPAFPTRRAVDGAFQDRFTFVEVDYVDAFEDSIALDLAGGNETVAKPWVAWVRSVRAWAAQNAPTLQITPRATYNGVKALVDSKALPGVAPSAKLERIADGVVLKTKDAGLRNRILAACPLPKVQL
jgi:hypothetical protein